MLASVPEPECSVSFLKDTVELREHNWVPRKAFLDNGPKTINQIRQDAVKVSFVDHYLPSSNKQMLHVNKECTVCWS